MGLKWGKERRHHLVGKWQMDHLREDRTAKCYDHKDKILCLLQWTGGVQTNTPRK